MVDHSLNVLEILDAPLYAFQIALLDQLLELFLRSSYL